MPCGMQLYIVGFFDFNGLAVELWLYSFWVEAILKMFTIGNFWVLKERTRMPGYNTSFDLTVEDMELIETALRDTKRSLSSELMDQADDPMRPCEDTRDLDASVKQINDLLGRLHNQKVFFRPRTGAYVGG